MFSPYLIFIVFSGLNKINKIPKVSDIAANKKTNSILEIKKLVIAKTVIKGNIKSKNK
jgi:hypothetical protein